MTDYEIDRIFDALSDAHEQGKINSFLLIADYSRGGGDGVMTAMEGTGEDLATSIATTVAKSEDVREVLVAALKLMVGKLNEDISLN